MHDYITAIILGIVEGLSEFLPVSSTGHLILVNEFFGFSGKFENMFNVVIQLGAIIAVIIFFWKRIRPFGRNSTPEHKKEIRNIWLKTIVGVLPALVIGLVFANVIEENLLNPPTVAIMLFLGGIILLVIERKKHTAKITSINTLSYFTALSIGLIQSLAMIPGTSRSAATIIGAMLLGCSRLVAAEFSFFLAIPTIFAATVYSLFKIGFSLSVHEAIVLSIGFCVSFIVAIGVISFFMSYIARKDFKLFGYYRILLAIAVFTWFYLIR